MTSSDILVVGSGSAGCVLAHELATRHSLDVTVVEPPESAAPLIDSQRPMRWLQLLGSTEDWSPATQPDAGIAGRSLRWPRGRGVGGSSRINSMIWCEPTADDFRQFELATAGALSVPRLRSGFARAESLVRPERPRWISPAGRAFFAAADGFPGGERFVYRRSNRCGRRWRAEELIDVAGIRLVRGFVDRVVWNGERAVGVLLSSGEIIHARHVVLSAGTVASPAILMRSGIGPAEHLTELGIDVRRDCADVGGQLRDHLVMPVVRALKHSTDGLPVEISDGDVARWQKLGDGPIASNIAEVGGLFADRRIQIHVTPTHYLTYPHKESKRAMTIAVNATKPRSTGRLLIESSDPHAQPLITPAYLSDPADIETTMYGVRLARELYERIADLVELGPELVPGQRRQADGAIHRSVARYSQTLYHPVGTCRAGQDDQSVVTDNFQVRGFENLSIVDASVFPDQITVNPNAMVMALAASLGGSESPFV